MRRVALALLLLPTTAPLARAAGPTGIQAAPLALPPRTAEAILADAVKAVGGEAALKAHKNMRIKLEMSFQGMGISGTAEHFATKDDKALTITDMPGMGSSKDGSNGKATWKQDPINGLRLLSGAEADWQRIETAWNPELRAAELFKSIEVKPDPSHPELECLLLTPREAPPVTDCYDAKTHLQVLQKGAEPTPQGDVPFASTLKDWREVGGLKVSFATETQAGPITFSAKITEVKFDVPMDDKMFEPPGGGAPAAAAEAPKGKAKGKPKTRAKKP